MTKIIYFLIYVATLTGIQTILKKKFNWNEKTNAIISGIIGGTGAILFLIKNG